MIRAKDAVVLVALAWWLLRDREETNVSLSQTCAFPDGSTVHVPLGSPCPGNSVLLTGETPSFVNNESWWSGQLPDTKPSAYAGMQGCGCENCIGCR